MGISYAQFGVQENPTAIQCYISSVLYNNFFYEYDLEFLDLAEEYNASIVFRKCATLICLNRSIEASKLFEKFELSRFNYKAEDYCTVGLIYLGLNRLKYAHRIFKLALHTLNDTSYKTIIMCNIALIVERRITTEYMSGKLRNGLRLETVCNNLNKKIFNIVKNEIETPDGGLVYAFNQLVRNTPNASELTTIIEWGKAYYQDSPSFYAACAVGLDRMGKYSQTIKFARWALELKSDQVEAMERLAYAYFSRNEYGKAREWADKRLKTMPYPKTGFIYALSATLYKLKGKHNQALAHFRRAFAMGFRNPPNWTYYGRVFTDLLFDLNKYHEAVSICQRVLEYYPDNEEFQRGRDLALNAIKSFGVNS